jgi:hypothetical protein
MRRLLLLCLLGLAALQSRAADPREAVLGTWKGTSLCTGALSACRDEIVVYHLTAGEKADIVTVNASKIVNGEEQEMGTIEFKVDFAAHRLTGEFGGRVPTRWRSRTRRRR